VRISYASILAADIVALSAFYRDTLGLADITDDVTDIYRGLDTGTGTTLAFSAHAVYSLLGIDDRRDAKGTKQYITFELDSDDEVERVMQLAVDNGATLVKGPFETSYDAWQVVLADPEDNIFRLNHAR
jgi:catechol 2,3-dioxygenase-like lactoylglutathione lyase family enzyme